LFKGYGAIKRIRIPKKVGSKDETRGFGFVEFTTIEEAWNAFENFTHGHLYGRKLVIEWAKKTNDIEAALNEVKEKTESRYSAMNSQLEVKRFKKAEFSAK